MRNERTLLLALLLGATVACEPARRTEIHQAVQAGDAAKTQRLLAETPALANEPDALGDTPLHRAAQMSNVEMAGLLLAAKADVNARAKAGWTALHWAAYWNHVAMAELLLRHHADVNAKNAVGYTPLHWAAWRNNNALVELLLAHKADVNARDCLHRTPLHYAVFWSSTNVIQTLIAHNADVNAKAIQDILPTGDAITPLDIAVRYGMSAAADLLLKQGAKRERLVFATPATNALPAHKPSTSPRPRR